MFELLATLFVIVFAGFSLMLRDILIKYKSGKSCRRQAKSAQNSWVPNCEVCNAASKSCRPVRQSDKNVSNRSRTKDSSQAER